MSLPRSLRMSPIHSLTSSMWTSPGSWMDTDPTESSCSCSPSVLRNSGSISSVLVRSKALRSRTDSTLTLDCCVRNIGANALMPRMRFSTRSRSCSETRSILLRRIRSANATCSTDSFSAPSGFSSSRCCSMCFASTTVTMPSRSAKHEISSSTKNVCATGAGSAMPVVSMTMPSSFMPASTFLASFSRTTTRSWRTVQQMQPFIISMSSSPSMRSFMFFISSASSMPTSPNSFSMTAMRLPCSAVRIWLRSVVFPEPRNPVKMVTWTLPSAMLQKKRSPTCRLSPERPGARE
mmetsp:Transcript_30604/g.94635  ORF Transcript_30604/g.94635 Transcript_30604/m.94635 type:complete len:293 (+) Transcript_30604:742-1620(+)